ncbi:MAG TPA: hypothetical protein PKX92_05450 [Edaphocola sp.]|nr:hypothetical protein [Edaphocola sp.]
MLAFRNIFFIFFILLGAICSFQVKGQNTITPKNNRLQGNSPFDTANASDTGSVKKKKPTDWDEQAAILSYKYYGSEVNHEFDSNLLFFHRNQNLQPVWYIDLGNWGSAANNLSFSPITNPGLRLGYNVWNVYRYNLDSIPFITTTRPYTSFSFMLGSEELQWVEFLHTQNINPNWNFTFKVANNSSDGFFNIQKVSGLNAFLTTNYKSKNQRYKANGAFIANNFKQDENGGIQNDSFLLNTIYKNRALIPVRIDPLGSTSKSPVSNKQTDLKVFFSHEYAWGKKDSVYNNDSTKVDYTFTPRFSLKHVLDIVSDQHLYKDFGPQAQYYSFVDSFTFKNNKDTVRSRQALFSIDNKFSLNTFLGKDSQQVHLEAGVGLKYDRFGTYVFDFNQPKIHKDYMSNFLFGLLRKDALKPGQWAYNAALEFIFTGPAIGNFNTSIHISKNFPSLGAISLGASQSLIAPSLQQEYFKTNFFEIENTFKNNSITQLYGNLYIKGLGLNVSLRNILMGNYIYLDESLKMKQYENVFSILQLSAKKTFYFSKFSLDNEILGQQIAGAAPLHLPALLLRHQLAYKLPMFKGKLDAYIGIEARYNTAYKADGYNAVWNQYFYQNSLTIDNLPALTAFFNFKVKRLRAFVLGDQIQQMVWKKNIINALGYPAANAHFRFGFNWIMMN